MPWVLTANDRLYDAEDRLALRALPLGAEVDGALFGGDPHGPPGILVGRGAKTPNSPEDVEAMDAAARERMIEQDMKSLPPNAPDSGELFAYARGLGDRLIRGPHFDDHFKRHRNLMEGVTGKTYPVGGPGEFEFLQDLGQLISGGVLCAEGIATMAKGQPMVYVFIGTPPNSRKLTAIVRPCGEWVTLLASFVPAPSETPEEAEKRRAGDMDGRLVFQMRFDQAQFPFPFVQRFNRVWRNSLGQHVKAR